MAKAETLREKQTRFLWMTCELMQFARANGYDLTYGEAWRPEETAEIYARQGRGIANSLHTLKLAIDFNLFIDGKYMRSSSAHRSLGEFWESIGGTWGGRWGDGNHYSLEHRGVK